MQRSYSGRVENIVDGDSVRIYHYYEGNHCAYISPS